MTATKAPLHLRGALARRQNQQFQDRHARAQVEYHGPGLTFGELAIGETFEWPPPIPKGPEPMVKSGDDRYQWSRGYGTAEPFYRVERVREP
jgi:hypothetical protein